MITVTMDDFNLREYHEGDMPFLVRLLGESPAMTFFPPDKIAEHARLWLEDQMTSYKTHGFGIWMLEAPGGEALGQCGLMMREIEEQSRVELGFSILREHRGRGLATRAARATVAWAGRNRIGRLHAVVDPDNTPARRVLEHCSFYFLREFERFGQKALLFQHHDNP